MNTTGGGRTILDCLMHKLPSSRKYYQVRLVIPDNGIPFIDYRQVSNFVGTKRPTKTIAFADLLFADKKHDTSEKFAFNIYTIDKTITFLPQDETVMNEWLTRIRELHSSLYPEFKRYDSIFEARLLDKGLATTMHIQGQYRLAVCKESLDLIPLLTVHDQQQQQQQIHNSNIGKTIPLATSITTATTTTGTASSTSSSSSGNHHHHLHHHLAQHLESNLPNTFHPSSYLQNQHFHHPTSALNQSHPHHHHLPQHLPGHQRFCKRHPQLASKTIELVLRSIRRCGHTQANFYIESGRHSQIGEGDLWMALDKKSTARQLHELLLATMKLASTTDDQYLFKAPRSRSGSSSDAHRTQQSRSSSVICLNADLSASLSNATGVSSMSPAATVNSNSSSSSSGSINTTTPVNTTLSSISTNTASMANTNASMQSNTNNNNNNDHLSSDGKHTSGNNLTGNFINSLFGNQPHQQLSPRLGASEKSLAAEANAIHNMNALSMFPNHDNNANMEEEGGYLPMA